MAVRVSSGRSDVGGCAHGVREAAPRSSCGLSVFLRNARARARILRRLPLPLLVCRGSFSVPRRDRGDRRSCCIAHVGIAAPHRTEPRGGNAACGGTHRINGSADVESRGVYRDAETLYRDTIARNPGAWMAYQNLGTELAAAKRFDEAIEAFEGALRARPGFESATANLALAHMKAGDADAESPTRGREAIAHYQAVARLEPNNFRAHYNAGTLLMDVPGGEPASLRHLESAVQIRPEQRRGARQPRDAAREHALAIPRSHSASGIRARAEARSRPGARDPG